MSRVNMIQIAEGFILEEYGKALNFWNDDTWSVEVTAIANNDGRIEAVVTAKCELYPQEEKFAARFCGQKQEVYFCYGEEPEQETLVDSKILFMELWYRIHQRLKACEKKLLEIPQE